eukprot:scpid99142/ scgid2448/ 
MEVQDKRADFFKGNELSRRDNIAKLYAVGLTCKQIMDLTGYKRTQVRDTVRKLKNNGEISRKLKSGQASAPSQDPDQADATPADTSDADTADKPAQQDPQKKAAGDDSVERTKKAMQEFFKGNERARRERIAALSRSGLSCRQIRELTGYKRTQVSGKKGERVW